MNLLQEHRQANNHSAVVSGVQASCVGKCSLKRGTPRIRGNRTKEQEKKTPAIWREEELRGGLPNDID